MGKKSKKNNKKPGKNKSKESQVEQLSLEQEDVFWLNLFK